MTYLRLAPSLLLVCQSVTLAAEYALPAANQGAWLAGTNVGVDGGINQYRPGGVNARTTLIDVTQPPYNADNTGVTSARTAIQAAIDAATSGQVVYLPAGTYRVDGALNIGHADDNITIRGAGAANTIIYGTGADIVVINANGGDQPYNTGAQTLNGTRTKGTTVLGVSSSAAYSVGEIATVIAENETDNIRIEAGAAPTWSGAAYNGQRRAVVQIKAVGSGTITVDPALPWDLTDVGGRIEHGSSSTRIEKVGFEDFSIEFNPAAHPMTGIQLQRGVECWFYGIETTTWTKSASNGQLLNIFNSYKCEVRRCVGIASTSSSSDGMLQIYYSSSCLIEDNIFQNWDVSLYEFGKIVNTVYSLNFILNSQSSSKFGLNQHSSHPSLILLEGNVIPNYQADGYHGSASHNTIFRNWLHGTNAAMTLAGFEASQKRFSRNYAHVGNVIGYDGFNGATFSYGYPNIGNSNYSGTAQPTTGDFWSDWNNTATLTTRTSDTAGVFTVSGGAWDAARTAGALAAVLWNSKASSRINMTIAAVSGNLVTLSGGSGTVLPAEGTSIDLIQTNTSGFQELDLDVEASLTSVHNYEAAAVGSGAVTDALTPGDTLPDSYVHASKPTWFGTLGWPAINPDSPAFAWDIIPAGYRYVHGEDPPTEGAPTGPTAPNTATLAAIRNIGATITWTDASDNETSFEIDRSTDNSAWAQVASVSANSTSYEERNLPPGTTYYYRVRAVNGAGDSANATPTPSSITTGAPAPVRRSKNGGAVRTGGI